MISARYCISAVGAVAAVLLAAGCQDGGNSPTGFTADLIPAPPPTQCANFRLTGGGRVDKLEPATGKSPPSSSDYATFGFQARPDPGCPSNNAGSGNIEWNEHLTTLYGGGFAFHGQVTFFAPSQDGTDPTKCGQFSGTGRLNPRNGPVEEGVNYEVRHACDVDEPGVQKDHIWIIIGPLKDGSSYYRHSLLTGGNIQLHKAK